MILIEFPCIEFISKNSVTGSKKNTNPNNANLAASGFVSSSKSQNVQVTFNGKIVTPQSLIVRKSHPAATGVGKYRTKGDGVGLVPTIDEIGPEITDKGPQVPTAGKHPMRRSIYLNYYVTI